MRLAGIIVAVALILGAFQLGKKLDRDAATQNVRAAKDQAERASGAAASGLERMLALFQLKAQGAASNPSVQALVRGGADEATFHDSLSTEEWSAPFRDRGGSVAVFAGETRAGSTPTMLGDEALRSVAVAAQRDGEASELVPYKGVFLIAGARLPFALNDGRKVAIVLARPASQDELDMLATVPLLLTDGKSRVATRGDASALVALAGREAEGSVVLSSAVATARPVGKLWVWALQPVGAEVAPALPPPAVWIGGVLVALGVLAFTFLASRGKGDPARPITQPQLPVPGTGSGLRAPQPPLPGFDAALDTTSPSQGGRSRYIEVAPLGEGGMARVSLAVTHGAEGFRRTFVVKRLKTELTVNPEIVAQFIDEARLGASLVHSNVVPVFDFGRDGEGYFMAQEYIMGRDLESVRRALFEKHRATLDPQLVLYVAHEALKALSYAHGKTDDNGKAIHLVHRDVSPNNLMISARGEVKLLDFGIVKAEGKLSQTQTGMVKGNVFYMSPEQARSLPVDARSDLFSLGLVMFTACAGEALYRGTSNYDLLTRAAEGLSQAEWERVRRLPPAIAELLERALQFDPKNRYASAEEFGRAIPAAQVGSAATMQQLMDALFRDDFLQERARFSSLYAAAGTR